MAERRQVFADTEAFSGGESFCVRFECVLHDTVFLGRT